MMQTNLQLDLAFNYLENTGTNIFLTGKAGTGKTTFFVGDTVFQGSIGRTDLEGPQNG